MLLREFLQEDMTAHLESLKKIKKATRTAEEDDIKQTLSQVDAAKKNDFIQAKEFEAKAPQIIIAKEALDDGEVKPEHLDKNMFSSVDKEKQEHQEPSNNISVSNNVDDSFSLRKVIREELSGLQQPMSYGGPAPSPSQLRETIKNELRSIIRDGGIDKIAKDETLRSIIHDELEKSGAINKQNKYTPDKIHIDESLLDPYYVDDDRDVKVIEIMEKSPEVRTKRDELSVLGKLEDWLVELKMLIREGSQDDAVAKFRRLKKETYQLRFFNQEKTFLLKELEYIAKGLFNSNEVKEPLKTVIIKESSQEMMDPKDFSNQPLDLRARKVYHLGMDKKGKNEIVDPLTRSVVVKKDIFGTEIRTQKDPQKVSQQISKVSHVVASSNMWTKPTQQVTFFVPEQSKNLSKKVYHQKMPEHEAYKLFSSQTGLSADVLEELRNDASKKIYIPGVDNPKKEVAPWENNKLSMPDPEHTKNYLRALRALRQREKHLAVDLLTDLHDKYPKNMAIKIRLQDALKL